jgi:uncharacterized protein
MSERDGFQPGVPCWVDTWQPDADRAAAFYQEVFGWEAEQTTPPDSDRRYVMLRLRDRDVAAVGSPVSEGAPSAPAWTTYVWVESADETAARAAEAGGEVLGGPDEALDGGRIAVVEDPAGAVIGAWQPGEHRGAQLVNEPGAWSMSLLSTPDTERAKAFYGAVFGWDAEPFELGGGDTSLFRLPGFVGGEPPQPVPRDVVGVMMPTAGNGGPGGETARWSVDFWIDDADAAADKATELGGSVVVPPYEVLSFRQAVLADPQGAAFSVSQLIVPG